MKKLLKWIGIILAILAGLLAILIASVYLLTNSRLNKPYPIQVESVEVPADAASIEYGKHVATIRACIDCHDPDLGGKLLIGDPMVGAIYTSNLTGGEGGIGGVYTTEDFVRALRHGVGTDGKGLIIMPANEFYYLSDKDLGAVIAYVKSVPPVNRAKPEPKLALPIRAMVMAGQVQALPVEMIDHSAPRPASPEPGVTVEYGKYLAVTCTGCHGERFSGGPIPGTPPDWPPPLNITPGGELIGWSEADFIQSMRTGMTPGGRQLRNQYMPWEIFGQMTDDELKALWLYLQGVPALGYGNR